MTLGPISIGFTGGRSACETQLQVMMLRRELLDLINAGFVWMCNGDCIGSDAKAAAIWEEFDGLVRLYPPDNIRQRAFYGAHITEAPRPYLERNRAIVDACSLLVATPAEHAERRRSGTWSTVRYARRLRRPIVTIFPDGTTTRENWPVSGLSAAPVDTRRMAETEGLGSEGPGSAVPEGQAPHNRHDTNIGEER